MTAVAPLSAQPTHHRRDPSCSHAPDAPGLTTHPPHALGINPQVGAADSSPATRLPTHSTPTPTTPGLTTHPQHAPGLNPQVGAPDNHPCRPTTHTPGTPTPTTPGLTTHPQHAPGLTTPTPTTPGLTTLPPHTTGPTSLDRLRRVHREASSTRPRTYHANTTTRHATSDHRAEQPNRRRLRGCPA